MNCKLCGMPTSDPPLRHDGHKFCCHGCREVYRCFGAGVFTADREGTRRTPPQTQGKEAYLWVEGMHCASCEFMIEKIALKTRGILSAAANFSTSTARIVYDPEVLRESDLPAILSRSDYRARLRGDGTPEYQERSDLLRLLTGGVLASAVMMLSFLFVYPDTWRLGRAERLRSDPLGSLRCDAARFVCACINPCLLRRTASSARGVEGNSGRHAKHGQPARPVHFFGLRL
jgi:Cu2+-exporting ATPase